MGLLDICLFAALGLTAGTLAGLLGIGGGMVIVPGLFYLLRLLHLPEEAIIHVAAGTSMSIMVCTAAASTWAHHAKGHIQWPMFKNVSVGIGLGVVAGNLLANHLQAHALEFIFGVFLLMVTFKLFRGFKTSVQEEQMRVPSLATTNAVGALIGFKSGVLGIGGGAISVPFLLYCGFPMSQASGTSASFTLPISIIGTLSFMLLGGTENTIPWSTGYLYWPAFLLVAPFTMLGAPLGAKLSRIVPADQLRLVFAMLLLFISLKMLAESGYLTWA